MLHCAQPGRPADSDSTRTSPIGPLSQSLSDQPSLGVSPTMSRTPDVRLDGVLESGVGRPPTSSEPNENPRNIGIWGSPYVLS